MLHGGMKQGVNRVQDASLLILTNRISSRKNLDSTRLHLQFLIVRHSVTKLETVYCPHDRINLPFHYLVEMGKLSLHYSLQCYDKISNNHKT